MFSSGAIEFIVSIADTTLTATVLVFVGFIVEFMGVVDRANVEGKVRG